MAIQILSEDVINQIAAGEVVERPAHLVKELVENAIDAGATMVEVDFSRGGKTVRVRDNGQGIDKNDLPLALQRHATSKITRSEDLWKIGTFGFRGEALASIAAVSHITLQSARPGQTGYQIEAEFGVVREPTAAGALEGTTIIVDRLFENVPPRLKFLKSDAAESSQIKNILKALAMAHPAVGFRVRQDDELVFFWPAETDLAKRVQTVLEQPELYENEVELERFKARVVVSPPHRVVHQSRQIWLFVKNRFVQDRTLQHAVTEAYRGLLMHGEYPIAAIFLDCPSAELDVNMHPTKSQVKFRNSSSAFRVVHHAVRQLLEKAPWVPKVVGSPVARASVDLSGNSVMEAVNRYSEATQVSFSQNSFADVRMPNRSYSLPAEPMTDRTMPIFRQTTPQPENVAVTSTAKWSSLALIGQADLTYILTQNESGLVLIDQHAAHERVLYEGLFQAWKTRQCESQAMLIPLTIDMAEEDIEAITPHLESLQKIGLEADVMGPQTLAVRSHPSMIKEEALVLALKRMAEEVSSQGQSFVLEKVMSEVFATMACHSAIRAGKAMSLAEMQSLLQQMDEYPLSSFCPHGRPVFVEISFQDLERRFGRIP